MGMPITEQDVRREAVRRYVRGERPCDICRALKRSVRWLNKWWHRYQHDPQTDFADVSRAPATSPQRIPAAVEQAIVTVRRACERGRTEHTRYGLIGHRSVQADLTGLQ